MYQDGQVTEPNPLSEEVARLTARNQQLVKELANASRSLGTTRTIVRDWFIEQFRSNRDLAKIDRDEVNELLESIDAKKLVSTWDVTLLIEVTAQVEAEDEEEAYSELTDDISVKSSDYKIDWDVTKSSATEAN